MECRYGGWLGTCSLLPTLVPPSAYIPIIADAVGSQHSFQEADASMQLCVGLISKMGGNSVTAKMGVIILESRKTVQGDLDRWQDDCHACLDVPRARRLALGSGFLLRVGDSELGAGS